MSEPELPQRTLLRLPKALRGRRRSAPKIERSSDVTRTYGWLAGSLCGGLGLAAAALLSPALGLELRDDASAAHPISRPHRLAQLECASCHGEARPGPANETHDPADACLGCHAGQRSVRAPHARLLASQTLRCTTCHQIHTGMGGVAFTPGADALRWRNGDEAQLREFDTLGKGGWSGQEPASVVLVELSACMNCHDPERADDPMAHCALAGHRGPEDAAVCFDEHQDLLTAAGTQRAALWELSREASVLGSPSLGPGPGQKPDDAGLPALALFLGLGLGFAGLGYGGTRLLAGRRDQERLERATAAAARLGEGAEPQQQLRPAERRRLPTIDATTCIGCSACVDACPYDVLEIRAYVAVLAKPDDCCGLTLCEQRCPNGSLVISEGERIADLPRLDDDLAALGAPGVYLAGDITGLPLIRNAINSGAHAVGRIAASLEREPVAPTPDLDLIIVGAGPAGISAALEAKRLGLRYLVLEQASAAQSIRSFPRGKLVFDQPLGMPMVGDLWLAEATKEELLAKWLRIIRQHDLAIHEGARVHACTRPHSGQIEVLAHTHGGEGESPAGESELRLRTRRVLLACGQRGTPRPLGVEIPDAMLDHVHYTLADARSFAGQRVCVVGLGDVAMEAAIGLAHQADTQVVVSYRGPDFKRGKRRNIEELRRLAATGRVELLWSSQVKALRPGALELQTPAGPRRLELDAVFAMIGNLPPTKLLDAFGVQRSGDCE